MIKITRLNGEVVTVNAGLIEFIEATPDTVISMVTGRKIMVRESVENIIEQVVAYHKLIGQPTIVHQDYTFGTDQQ
ncbi:MAG TPA: flagellar FlbD family protein [Armatimonadota bacterium]|nr:flagellar FlbD family protein [Armatimonadota bacterium]